MSVANGCMVMCSRAASHDMCSQVSFPQNWIKQFILAQPNVSTHVGEFQSQFLINESSRNSIHIHPYSIGRVWSLSLPCSISRDFLEWNHRDRWSPPDRTILYNCWAYHPTWPITIHHYPSTSNIIVQPTHTKGATHQKKIPIVDHS